MSDTRIELQRAVWALTVFGKQGDYNFEDLIANSEDASKKVLVTQADMENQAGKLFDLLSQGKGTLSGQEIATFMDKHPDCVKTLGFEVDKSSPAGYTAVSSFAAILDNTANILHTRDDFSKVIGKQAYEIYSENATANGLNPAIKASELTVSTNKEVGYYIAGAYTRAHPGLLLGGMKLPENLQSFDKNGDHAFDINELRKIYQEVVTHEDKYIIPASPTELQKAQQQNGVNKPGVEK